MSLKGFVRFARADQIPPGTMKGGEVGDEPVLVANVDGRFHALHAACPHMGADLSAGTLDGSVVTCPVHGWRFDVTSGRQVGPPAAAACRVDVLVRDGVVCVRA